MRSVTTSHIGPCEVFVTLMGPFCGYFMYSPFDGMFLCLSLTFCKFMPYTQIGSPVTTWSVPTSNIGPARGVRDSYGTVLLLFLVFTIRWHVFMLKSNILQICVAY